MISVWNFVLWNEFSLKFCALKWIQFEILYSEINSFWNFVLWNDFRLKICALKWFQSEILFSEMNSVWSFVLWNDFRLKICALKWIQYEFCALKWIQSEILCSELFCSKLKFFVSLGHRMLKTHIVLNLHTGWPSIKTKSPTHKMLYYIGIIKFAV